MRPPGCSSTRSTRTFARRMPGPTGGPSMRLNKHISDSGLCSRREADRLVAEGRVTVDGQRARIGAEVGEGADVRIDGQKLAVRQDDKGQRKHVYIMLKKPEGITCTTESAVKGNLSDFVSHQQRIF